MSKKKTNRNLPELLFIVLCLGMVLALSLGTLLRGPSAALANERQNPAPKLTAAGGGVNTGFPGETLAWFSDHFYLRRELITGRSRLWALFGSSTAADVLLGSGGWLYYAPSLDDYTGADPMTEAELAAAARNLALMAEYCESRGACFLYVTAPNKSSLYPDHMPGYAGTAEPHDAQRLHDYLDAAGVAYADLFALFGGRAETLYFAHDSHWSSRGAALAADRINAALGRESGYFSDAFAASAPHTGDLFEMLYPAAADPETDPVYGGALAFTRDGGTRPDAITINTASEGAGTLLCFRDSFGNLLYPYLAHSFARARFSRAAAYDLTQVEDLGADCVLVELVERNLDWLLANVPVMPAPAREAPEAAAVSGTVFVSTAEAGAPAGCALVRGALPETPAGPVYLCCGDAAYEAFTLSAGGFAAYLPAGAAPDTVRWLSAAGPAALRAEPAVSETAGVSP